ncbi:MAG TPA: DinB family protein [Candidatus Acidoferrum sp.]|nr:DinB family protein [Candidatus Acidoferrum sp.]
MTRPLTPDLAEFWLQDLLLGTLKNESRTTQRILEAVPADKADYRPDPISKTAMDLVRHIAAAEMRFLETTINAEFSTTSSLPDSVKTPAEVAAWYSENFARNFERLAQLKGDHLVKITDFRGIFKLPAVAFLQVGMNHSIHHRGQLSSYLRCMGAKVPSIYGESYDDAQARKAAQA